MCSIKNVNQSTEKVKINHSAVDTVRLESILTPRGGGEDVFATAPGGEYLCATG